MERPADQALNTMLHVELRSLAERRLRKEGRVHTLTPTELVSELYLRLGHDADGRPRDGVEIKAMASTTLRHLLVDHARARGSEKRGGGRVRVDVTASGMGAEDRDVLELHEAIEELAELDRRQAEIVELKFFGGLTNREVAQRFGISERMIEKEWSMARTWFRRRLAED